jgi:hypothetical protein
MRSELKVASFTVHASQEQSIRWKRGAEAEGFRSVGTWLSRAVDAYLRVRARAGNPIPLAWHAGSFMVRLETGREVPVAGHVSPPFGIFTGTDRGPIYYTGGRRFTLVYLPGSRLIATLCSYRQCQQLASEMAPVILRGDAAEIVERHRRESA